MSVRRSLAWTYAAQVIAFVVTFASTIVVARLVTPRDFGIFAMAGAVTTIINVFMQFGLAKYIMREGEIDREKLRAVFTVNVFMSLIYSASILVGSVVARGIFDSEEVGRFLLVFAIFPLLAMMEFIPSALCARDMKFGTIAAVSVLRAIVLAALTIWFAVLGYAYMSFAWAQVLTWLVTAIAFNIVLWRPDVWRLRFKGSRAILKFGTQMIGVSGMSQLNIRAGDMTLGSLLGLSSLGLYTRASSLPQTLLNNVLGASRNVIFSKLAKDNRETGTFHETYLHFMRLVMALLWPMMLGVAVLAQPLILNLYGPQWQAAAVPLALLTIATAITVTLGLAAEVFILRDQTGRQVRIEAWRAGVGFAIFGAGAMVSLTMAALARVAEAVFAFVLYRKPMIDLVGGGQGRLASVYREAAFATLVAILPALVLMLLSSWSPLVPLWQIAAAVALGVAGWALLLIWLKHPLYVEVRRFLKARGRP